MKYIKKIYHYILLSNQIKLSCKSSIINEKFKSLIEYEI